MEVIFYQTDCTYIKLVENQNKVNRMSTENYKLSDLMNSTDNMTFDSDATNLIVDKKRANYLIDEEIRSKLSYT